MICPGNLPTCPALSSVTSKQGKWRRRDHHSPLALLAFSRLVLPLSLWTIIIIIYTFMVRVFNILGDQKRITTIKSLWRRQPHVPKRVIPVCSAVVLFKPVKGNSDPFPNLFPKNPKRPGDAKNLTVMPSACHQKFYQFTPPYAYKNPNTNTCCP